MPRLKVWAFGLFLAFACLPRHVLGKVGVEPDLNAPPSPAGSLKRDLRSSSASKRPTAEESASREIEGLLASQLNEDQKRVLGKDPGLESLVGSMSPEQKQASSAKLQELASQAPSPLLLAKIGEAQGVLGRYSDMLASAAKLRAMEPESSKGFALSATALNRTGNYEQALSMAEEALKRDPGDPAATAAKELSIQRLEPSRSLKIHDPFKNSGIAPEKRHGLVSAGISHRPKIADDLGLPYKPELPEKYRSGRSPPPAPSRTARDRTALRAPEEKGKPKGSGYPVNVPAAAGSAVMCAIGLYLEKKKPEIKKFKKNAATAGKVIAAAGGLACVGFLAAPAVPPLLEALGAAGAMGGAGEFGGLAIAGGGALEAAPSLAPAAATALTGAAVKTWVEAKRTPYLFSHSNEASNNKTAESEAKPNDEIPEGASNDVRKPRAENQRLQRAINELFKKNDKDPGGTAGAVRKEFKTGMPTQQKFHLIKAAQRITQMERILEEEELSSTDRATGKAVLEDLKQAVALYEK